MGGESALVGDFHAIAAGFANGGAAGVVFIRGGDVGDAFV